MTLEDIANMEKEFLIPREVAPILGMDQYSINLLSKKPDALGFPVIRNGSRVIIPRRPFLEFMGYKTGEQNKSLKILQEILDELKRQASYEKTN